MNYEDKFGVGKTTLAAGLDILMTTYYSNMLPYIVQW